LKKILVLVFLLLALSGNSFDLKSVDAIVLNGPFCTSANMVTNRPDNLYEKTVYVNSIADLPVSGDAILIPDEAISYKFNERIDTSLRLVLPSNNVSFEAVNLASSGFLYNGSETFISGKLSANSFSAFSEGFLLLGTQNGTLFNIEGTDSSTLFLEKCIVGGWGSLGAISNCIFTFNTSQVTGGYDGLTLNSMQRIGFLGIAWNNWQNQANSIMVTVTGNTHQLNFNNHGLELNANESFILVTGNIIDSIEMTAMTNNLPSNFFAPGSLTGKDLRVKVTNVSGINDSSISGRLNLLNNSTVTTINTAGDYYPVGGAFTDGVLERVTLECTCGELTYIGLATSNVRISGGFSIVKALAATERQCKVRPILLGVTVNITFDSDTDTITSTSHGLADGDRIEFKEGTAIATGITNKYTYYIINKTDNTYQISATSGGSAIDFTTNGTAPNYHRLITYLSDGLPASVTTTKAQGSTFNDIFEIEPGESVRIYATCISAENIIITQGTMVFSKE